MPWYFHLKHFTAGRQTLPLQAHYRVMMQVYEQRLMYPEPHLP